MVNFVDDFNSRQVRDLSKNFPDYAPGDLVKISYRIIEGDSSRIQIFEGIVISKERSKANFSSTFTVRKISHNIGVERKFPLYSPLVEKIEIMKKGSVRKGKLYYLRKLRGKSARIKEKTSGSAGAGGLPRKSGET
ncbi:MAG: 50S ribosomal protein L19 [Rickettsiales bacterium]|jgi:large subunit ribosomal protein L19|nr:50S ribosomal protein L19 [Rickettsiales bacterium]